MKATLVALVAVGLFSSPAAATTISFTGTLAGAAAGLGFSAGDPFSGSFTYGSSLPTYASLPPSITAYTLGAAETATFAIGATYTGSAVGSGNGDKSSMTVSNNNGINDSFDLRYTTPAVSGPNIGVNSLYTFVLYLNDSTGTAFSSTAVPPTLLLSDFNFTEVNFGFVTPLGNIIYASGTLNSLTMGDATAVPEPATLSLLSLGIAAVAARRRRRR